MAGNKRKRHLLGLLGVATQFIVRTTAESLGALYDGTGFTAPYRNPGFTFEILAKSEALVIERLDINLEVVASEQIKVWSKPGVIGTPVALSTNEPVMIPYFEAGNTGWTLIQAFPGVVGQGKGSITSLPAFNVPIVIPAGFKQSFYVTASYTEGGQTFMHYDFGTVIGNAYESNSDMDILEGCAVNHASVATRLVWTCPRLWSGIVHYSVDNAPTTSAPTDSLMPSDVPSSQTSPKPSSQPSSQPSTLPSGLPSVVLSSDPSVTPSLFPSNAPSDDPSQTPSSTPSSYPSLLPISKFVPPTPSPTKESTDTVEHPMPSRKPSLSPSRDEAPSKSPPPTSSSFDPKTPKTPRMLTVKPTRAPFSSAHRMIHMSSRIFLWLSLLLTLAFF